MCLHLVYPDECLLVVHPTFLCRFDGFTGHVGMPMERAATDGVWG